MVGVASTFVFVAWWYLKAVCRPLEESSAVCGKITSYELFPQLTLPMWKISAESAKYRLLWKRREKF